MISVEAMTGIVAALFVGAGTVILFVDRQRKAWVLEVQATMQREIDELKAAREADHVHMKTLAARIESLEIDRSDGRAALSDAMILVARGATPNETLEALKIVAVKLH